MRRLVAALGFFFFCFPISCLGDDSEVEELTILPCVPGDQQACTCPEGGRGISECVGNGSGYGECVNCGTSCTLYPNCGGCITCWETCVCQGGGNIAGCQATCLTGAQSSGAGGSGGATCTVETCPDSAVAQIAAKCCTERNVCGFSVSLLGPGCVEANQPGNLDSSCEPFTLPVIAIELQGCCRPNGLCGVLDTLAGFGCTDPSAFGQPFQPASCTP